MSRAIGRRTLLQLAAGTGAATWLPRRATAQSPVRIGFTLSRTGPYSVGAGITQLPTYQLWVEQVNAKGGLAVAGETARRPIQLIEHDDRSEIETAVRLYEKMITDDKVDLLLPPWGTAMNFAVAPVANKYGYPLIGPTATSLKIKDLVQKSAVDKVSADLKRALSDEEVKKNLGMMAIEAVYSTPEQFGAFIKSERKLWGDVIREAKISGNQ